MTQSTHSRRRLVVEVDLALASHGEFVGQAAPYYEVFGATSVREVVRHFVEQTRREGRLVKFYLLI